MAPPEPFSRLFLDPLRALAFLSRIPVTARVFDGQTHANTAQSAWAYPLAGLIIAAPACALTWLVGVQAPFLTAALAIVMTIIVTGALHEDGLADVADGFWGGHTIERRLEIMKDSAIGSYGTLALVSVFVVKVTALGTVLEDGSLVAGVAALVSSLAVSRSAITAQWVVTPSARHGGVADTAGQPTPGAAVIALALALVIALISGTLAASLAALLAALAFTVLCRSKIGGHTGDTLGATQQISEAVMLAALAFGL